LQNAPRINARELVATTVAGQITNPVVGASPYRVGRDGVLRVLPGTGGIVLNRRVGDRAVGLAGDHIEPGVSIRNSDTELGARPNAANQALMAFSCIGNLARVTTGPALGAVGTVIGKHGGINHLIVDFPLEVRRALRIGDRLQIAALGQGLRLRDAPGVRALNLAPRLLARWGVRVRSGIVEAPVTHLVPAGLIGSGLGRPDGVLGDFDIQLSDPHTNRRQRLDTLRFGDIVAVVSLDARFGPTRRRGFVTIGVVVHSDSTVAGHGPGVTPLLVGPLDLLRPIHTPDANLAAICGLRRALAPQPAPDADELSLFQRLGTSGGTRSPNRQTRQQRLHSRQLA
jgi:hypothetical protein